MRTMNKGFTLIELLAAVLVIGVLSSIAMPQYFKSIERARMVEGIQMLPAIYDSFQRWEAEHPEVLTLPDWKLLDMSMKGKPGNPLVIDGRSCPTWVTSNYVYFIYASGGIRIVVGGVRRGKYAGNFFAYAPENDGMSSGKGDAHVYCGLKSLTKDYGVLNACTFMGYEQDGLPEYTERGALPVFAFLSMNGIAGWAAGLKEQYPAGF